MIFSGFVWDLAKQASASSPSLLINNPKLTITAVALTALAIFAAVHYNFSLPLSIAVVTPLAVVAVGCVIVMLAVYVLAGMCLTLTIALNQPRT